MQFSPLYTGRDSAAKFPELDALERSQQRASELAIAGEEKKLSKFLKDKDTFQKMLAIDPVVAVSQVNATRQAESLKKYNAKWAERYARSEGKLSFADEVEMQQDKSLLQAEQGKILADQEQYQSAKEIMQRDTRGYYDKDNFIKAEQEYFNTGKLPSNMLDVAPQSITNYLSSLKPLTDIQETVTEDVKDAKGNVVGKRLVDVSKGRTQEQAQYAILEAMQEEPMLKTVIRDFDGLSPEEQMKWVGDYDRNGVVDPADVKYAHERTDVRDNPIVKWALQNPTYLDAAMQKKVSSSKALPSASSGKGGLMINFGGQKVSVSPAYKRKDPVTYGDKVYYNSYNFPGKNLIPNIPTNGGKVFIENYSEDIEGGNIQGYIKDYIPDEDVVIIEATKGYPDLNIKTGGLVAIPAGNITDIDNLPITDGGKTMTIGDLRGNRPSQTATPKKSGVTWKK